jgi:hypothetical protein
MIWLPSPVCNVALILSLPVCRRSSLLTGRGVLRAKHTTSGSLTLYKSFNTTYYSPSATDNQRQLLPFSLPPSPSLVKKCPLSLANL